MQITQEVRDYAARHGLDAESALKEGLKEKAEEFRERLAEVNS
jgi:phosphomethylpyrimidine synthase